MVNGKWKETVTTLKTRSKAHVLSFEKDVDMNLQCKNLLPHTHTHTDGSAGPPLSDQRDGSVGAGARGQERTTGQIGSSAKYSYSNSSKQSKVTV